MKRQPTIGLITQYTKVLCVRRKPDICNLKALESRGKCQVRKRHYKPCIQFCCLSQKQAPNLFPVFKENRDVIGIVKHSIIRKAHKMLMAESTVLPLVDLGSVDLKYNEYIVPKNLLAALYYQVYSDVLGQKNLKQCVYCLEWFEEQRKDQLYCPEFITDYETGKLIPTGKHCKKYDFTKNKPEVIRVYNEGMSVEKIAELLRREIKQISNWVKNAGES